MNEVKKVISIKVLEAMHVPAKSDDIPLEVWMAGVDKVVQWLKDEGASRVEIREEELYFDFAEGDYRFGAEWDSWVISGIGDMETLSTEEFEETYKLVEELPDDLD